MRVQCFHLSRYSLLAVVLISLLVVVLPASAVKADSVVTFPDPNLEAAIRDALGKPTGDIYESDLASLSSFEARFAGIADLTGLEYCTSLTYMDVGGNEIGSISSLAGLTGLTYLCLHANQIVDISPLADLINLTYLALGYNQVSDISPLVGLTDLESLGLGSNLINDISPLAALTGLVNLYLQDNQLDDVSLVAGLSMLCSLDLSDNQIGDISPIASLTHMTSLLLNDNQISDLSPLISLTDLWHLGLANNEIGEIEALVTNPGMASGDDVDLRGNPLNRSSINTYIPALEARGVTVYWDYPAPDQPSNTSPVNAATEVSVTPTLQASAFSDPDGDSHAASQWQMRTSSGTYSAPLWDRTVLYPNLTQYAVTQLDGLDGYTTYYWRVRYQDEHLAWSSWSTETSFTTGSPAPLVTTSYASGVAARAARLNGSLISLGTASSGTVSFVWGTSPGSYPNETSDQTVTSVGYYELWFYFDLSGLTPGTTYYYKGKAVGDGTSYGAEKSFTTLPATPLVTTGDASGIITSAARLNGNLTSLGTASSVAVTFVWGTSPGSYSSETTSQTMTGTGAFYSDLGLLAPGKTYYYKAKAAGDGTSYGAEMSFTTATAPPVVATNDATSITTTSATLNGDLTSMGTAVAVTVSFQCGTTPGGPYNLITEIGKDTIGTFSVVIDGLTPGTTYYYTASADGDGDPVYGAEKSFTTGRSPEVGALDPIEGKRKQHLTVTIIGANFDGATSVSFGSEITVDDFDVVSSTQITVEITIGAKAAKGIRDVSVTTDWGTATKAGGFTVVGGGGGVCSGSGFATPGAPSEMTTVLVALGLLLGASYLLAKRGIRSSIRA